MATTWSLTGNAGTNPATNFLGTKDSKPLSVQPGIGNVGIGTRTPSGKLRIRWMPFWRRLLPLPKNRLLPTLLPSPATTL